MFASNLIKIEGKFKKETNKADTVSHYDNPSSVSANPEGDGGSFACVTSLHHVYVCAANLLVKSQALGNRRK